MFKNMIKYWYPTLVIMIALFLLHGQVQSDQIKPRELKFSMGVGPSSPWTQSAERFAKIVEEKTDGKIKVKVYPNGILSNGNQITEFDLLKTGTIDITFHSSIILSVFDQKFALFSLPWIGPKKEQLFRIIDGPGQKIWQELEKQGVLALGGYSSSGYRQLTNNVKPIVSPADIRNLTVRVPGLKMYTEIFKELGANPVTTSFSELYGSLQQGVVNGQENPISLIKASKFYEVQKFMTIWNYSADSIGILINRGLWEKIDPQSQKILKEAAKDAAGWHRDAQAREDADALSEVGKYLKIVELDSSQIETFRKQMDPVYERFEKIIGLDLVKAAESIAKGSK